MARLSRSKKRADIRDALKAYADKFGMPAAMEDGRALFVRLFGDGCDRVSRVPDGRLDDALNAIREAIATNPFEREVA